LAKLFLKVMTLVAGELTRFCMNTLTRKNTVIFSYIDGVNSSSAYIAAQGPLSLSNELFWQFVWKQGVAAVVILAANGGVANFDSD
jgi:protein tyrosine phosphatase